MHAMIKVKKGDNHKNFVKTCNQWGVTLKATSGVEDFLYFIVNLEEDQLSALCKTTKATYYSMAWIEEERVKRTSNYETIYGDHQP